jgi:hypothetical protein
VLPSGAHGLIAAIVNDLVIVTCSWRRHDEAVDAINFSDWSI